MNKKTIATLTLSAIIAGLAVSATNADFGDKEFGFDRMEMKQDFKKGHKGGMKGLTDEEKTEIESMTDEEKIAFFETKKAEKTAEREAKKAEKEAHNNVIDKLLAGETLTEDEEVLREEIIEKRLERKAEKEARQAEMDEIKTIMEKKKAGEDLTEDEESKLDEMKGKFRGGKFGKKVGYFRGINR